MKINKTKLLFIATLLFLAIPLVMMTGNAQAVTAVSGTYNTDAAVQDAASGQWDLPSNFYCIAPPASWDGTGAIPSAVERDDLAAPSSSPYGPAGCAATAAQAAAIKAQLTTPDLCVADGYAWSGYSKNCGAATWTATDPDNSPLPYYTDHKGCLRCHQEGYINGGGVGSRHYGDTWAMKESYLKGGHKNMVRKVTQGLPWGLPGTDASGIYAADGTGNPIDWANGTINIAGTDYTMYWIYGGNGLEGTAPSVISSKGGSYSCGRCHATGWSSDASINTQKEPEASFPGILSQAPAINTKGGITGDSNNYSSWDRFGIQCSRCHVATGDPSATEPGPYSSGHATWPEATTNGGDVTALCMNCHRQETGGVPDVLAGYKVAADSPASTLVIGSSHGGPVGFVSHSHGTQFLNSPHARMSGTWSQIGCPPVSISPAGTAGCDSSMSTYNSDFAAAATADGLATGDYTKSVIAGGCTACHDVHKTVLENTAGQSDGATTECTACHSNVSDTLTPQVDLSSIKHPNLPGTPLDDPNPCAVCHMPGGQHVFRISTDVNYTEFPDAAKTADMAAPTAPDEDGFPAVWVDLDQACGQCHGGGTTNDANHQTKNGAPYMTKAYLAVVAKGMHAQSTTPPAAVITSATASGMTVTVVDGSTDATSTTVKWGDGSLSTQASDTTFTHTYKVAGTYPITLTAQNDANMFDTASTSITAAPLKYTISGNVTYQKADGTAMTPSTGAMVVVKKTNTGTTVWYQRNVIGAYSTTPLNTKSYYVFAVRKNFTCTSQTVNLTTDTTVDILCTRTF